MRAVEISSNDELSGTALMLSTPNTPAIVTASVGVGLSIIRINVALLNAVVGLPKMGVKLAGDNENDTCVQLPPTGRNAPKVVTA